MDLQAKWLTYFQVIDKVGNRKCAKDNPDCEYCMLECRHFSGSAPVRDVVVTTGANRARAENIVEGDTTCWDHYGIREHDKDCNRQLSSSNGDRTGRVHGDDVGANLPWCEGSGHNVETIRPTLEPKVR